MHKLLKFWFIHCTQLQLATKMFLLLKNICWPTGKSHGMATFQRFYSFFPLYSTQCAKFEAKLK